jgi:hypothetical protein
MGYAGFVGFELLPSETDEKAIEAIRGFASNPSIF